MLADNAPPPVNPQMQQWQGLNDSPAPPPAAADETRRWWIYKWLSGSISVYDDRRDAGPSGIPVAPVAELEAMQRERDEAMNEMMHWNGESVRLENECATLRAQLASALDAARKELQSAQRDLDAARDRARVAEQRIENGDECWHFTSPSRDVYYPYNVSSSDPLGRCTRGRFVADQEGT